MDTDPPPPRPFPAEFARDDLTLYIYRHFRHLLTEEELAADRIHLCRFYRWSLSEHPYVLDRLHEAEAQFPHLTRRIDQLGLATVMRAAADRVLRDNLATQILHNCPKCGQLCRTPRAEQCFACGFDWHPAPGG